MFRNLFSKGGEWMRRLKRWVAGSATASRTSEEFETDPRRGHYALRREAQPTSPPRAPRSPASPPDGESTIDVLAMAASVAASLWDIRHRPAAAAPSLILPTKRDGDSRVSEQESRVLLLWWLERRGIPHSIETPTVESYRQTGATPLSGRIDVTAYRSREPDSRILNVELKKGTSDDEAVRKDLEKLLRERTDGLWFHTLDKLSRRTWGTIEERIRRAFESERKYVDAASHSLSFAFCVLEPPQFVWFELDLDGHFESQWPQAMRDAVAHPSTPPWWKETPPTSVHFIPPRPAHQLSRKGHEKWLIYCREICADSFVHLNIQGSSYRLRFGCFGTTGWVDPAVPTTEHLRSHYEFAHQFDVRSERVNLVTESQYWLDRISALNRQYGIQPAAGERR